MKKKLLAILMCSALAFSTAACGAKQESAPAGEAKSASAEKTEESSAESASAEKPAASDVKVTALFNSLEGEYFMILDSCLKEECENRGYTYESQSSNGDDVVAIEQIENSVAKGTDVIWIWSINGPTVADALKAARREGVIVYAFVTDPGDEACDVYRGTDVTSVPKGLGKAARAWADELNAEKGSINAIILGDTHGERRKAEFENLIAEVSADDRYVILDTVDIEASVVNAQQAAENMFSKYGDKIDCFLGVGGEFTVGVSAFLNSDACSIDNPKDVGVFGTQIDSEIAEYMRNGTINVTVVTGGNIMLNMAEQVEDIEKLVNGEEIDHFSEVNIDIVYPDELEMYGF